MTRYTQKTSGALLGMAFVICTGLAFSSVAAAPSPGKASNDSETSGAGGEGAGKTQPDKKTTRIQLTFPDQVELKTVLDYVSSRLNTNILYDQEVGSRRVTIRSPKPVRSDQLLPLLRSMLRFRGFVLSEAEAGAWYKVRPADELAKAGQWVKAKEAQQAADHRVVTSVIELEHIQAKRFKELANPFLSQGGGNVISLPGGQRLVVTDYARVLKTIERLKRHADRPGARRKWKIYHLKKASPPQIDGTLQSLLSAKPAPNAPGSGGGSGGGSDKVKAVPIPQLEGYLLTGTPKQIREAEALIAALDQKKETVSRFYEIEHTSPQRAATLLRQLLKPKQAGKQQGDWTITTDTEGGSLLVTCSPAIHKQIEQWLKQKVDVESAGETTASGISTRVFPVKFAQADELASTLRNVFSGGSTTGNLNLTSEDGGSNGTGASEPSAGGDTGITDADEVAGGEAGQDESTAGGSEAGGATAGGDSVGGTSGGSEGSESSGASGGSLFGGEESPISLTVDKPTNSIIATGPPSYLRQIERLIKRLDHHRPQVLIEATIVTMSATETLDLGAEFQFLSNENGQLDQGALTSFGLSELEAATGSAEATFGSGLNAVLMRAGEVNILLKALQTKLNAKVVAEPQLLVADNQTGSLNSFDEEPFTSVNAGDTISTTSFGGYAEAGTELELTPHISESDIVHLDYRVQTSSFTGSSTNANLPPPRSTDSVTSRVTIPTGYTLLVGGLKRENDRTSREQVPILGDMPVLGRLFESRSDNDSQTVLYIFLKPVIHREDRFAYLRYQSRQALEAADIPSDAPKLTMEPLK